MRVIQLSEITNNIKEMCIEANHFLTSDMDEALKLGLEMTLEHLKRQGAEVSPESREALEYLNVKV